MGCPLKRDVSAQLLFPASLSAKLKKLNFLNALKYHDSILVATIGQLNKPLFGPWDAANACSFGRLVCDYAGGSRDRGPRPICRAVESLPGIRIWICSTDQKDVLLVTRPCGFINSEKGALNFLRACKRARLAKTTIRMQPAATHSAIAEVIRSRVSRTITTFSQGRRQPLVA